MTLDQAPTPHVDASVDVAPPLWRRLLPPTLVVGGLGAATVALHFRDPHEEGSWGQCPSAALGFWCPGCGGLRAVNLLSNGQIVQAASSNLLFVASLPLIAYIFVRWTLGRATGRGWAPQATAINLVAGVFLVAMVVFTVVRNLPLGSWLAP